jgi:hypothetical protein
MAKPARVFAVSCAFAVSSILGSQPAFSIDEDTSHIQEIAPQISQLSFEDELDDFLEAKDKLRKALEAYKAATASNIQERYKTALAAYKEASKELLTAKNEIMKEFNSTVKEANAEFAKVKNSKPKPTALKLAAATKAKDAKIAAAVTQRDSALAELGSIGAEPAKPAKVPTPTPTKKKS